MVRRTISRSLHPSNSTLQGAGNSVFPLLSANRNADLKLLAYDYSNHAVKLVQVRPLCHYDVSLVLNTSQTNSLYTSPPIGTIQASVWDLASRDTLPQHVLPESVDIVVLVFVLSALHPNEWRTAVNNAYKVCLQPLSSARFCLRRQSRC